MYVVKLHALANCWVCGIRETQVKMHGP